jgi:hydroxymethylpyrimidine pyrophosphatase-like HAD family hydrolase
VKSEAYAFDIDGTIFDSKVLKNGKYKIIKINYDLIEKINKMHSAGYEIVFWTGRHWNHFRQTKNQLDFVGVKYDTLLMGKPVVNGIVDDKSMQPEEFMKLNIKGIV